MKLGIANGWTLPWVKVTMGRVCLQWAMPCFVFFNSYIRLIFIQLLSFLVTLTCVLFSELIKYILSMLHIQTEKAVIMEIIICFFFFSFFSSLIWPLSQFSLLVATSLLDIIFGRPFWMSLLYVTFGIGTIIREHQVEWYLMCSISILDWYTTHDSELQLMKVQGSPK